MTEQVKGVVGWVAARFGYAIENTGSHYRFHKKGSRPTSDRGYDAGKMSDLYADFVTSSLSADGENMTLPRVRARSRDLCMNNPYAKKYLKMLRDNVVGPNGIPLQMKSRDLNGKLDTFANNLIEAQFKKWSKKGTCTVDGRMSFKKASALFVETAARDGECIVRKVRFDNSFNFALQFIEADHLEADYFQDLSNGNKIRMGIEFDTWGRPVAYWFLKNHPGDIHQLMHSQKRERVPAGEIIHGFDLERPGQSRSMPWNHTSVNRYKMLGGYEEAELVASRGAASKMGFFERGDEAAEFTGDDKTAQGQPIDEATPGHFGILPKGWKFSTYDPQHPASNFATFVKSMLRSIASGMGVSYNSMANDLEGVNFSSMRSGKLEERDGWQTLQGWAVENFLDEVFSGGTINWLTMAFLSGKLAPLPISKFEKFDAATWRPRGWQWVDPQKEVKAYVEGRKNKLITLTSILSERGIDLEEFLREWKAEEELAAEIGVDISPEEKTAGDDAANGDDENDDEDAAKKK